MGGRFEKKPVRLPDGPQAVQHFLVGPPEGIRSPLEDPDREILPVGGRVHEGIRKGLIPGASEFQGQDIELGALIRPDRADQFGEKGGVVVNPVVLADQDQVVGLQLGDHVVSGRAALLGQELGDRTDGGAVGVGLLLDRLRRGAQGRRCSQHLTC